METNLSQADAKNTEKLLHILSSTWTSSLFIQMASGAARPKEFLQSNPGLSAKVLSERMTTLREHGLVERESFGGIPPRVEYSLTPEGLRILPLLERVKELSFLA
ncbi:MAG: helix-turn-helix transcriptional regulator [Candidatus Melainabacteria bacterium]|jgi:DNA-binding HxlR family transcriptional regulator|nr:helix-turn-helix transcriptional regulator [Candidatus Melainabacteria bacterium]